MIKSFISEREKHRYYNSLSEEQKYDAFNDILFESEHVVFLGGAGVSTESGIPDFRSKNGLYKKRVKAFGRYKPEYLLSSECLRTRPELFFDYYRQNMDARKAEPNAAHFKLAEMEKSGRLEGVITQNIDGLHQAAGSKNVLELHGSIHRCYCMRCGRPYPAERVNHGTGVPHCDCGGIIRPDIVFYEECLDDDVVSKAVHYIREAEVLIVGGTSLAVYPAAGLLNYYRGNKLVLINRSATPYDDQANLIIHEKIGEVFAQV